MRCSSVNFNNIADTRKDREQKALLSQVLLALLMYTAITPVRSKEYFTLQL